MGILRCIHCGGEGDDSLAIPHKSTCKSTGKDETYTRVSGSKPKPAPEVKASSPTTTKKSKGSKK